MHLVSNMSTKPICCLCPNPVAVVIACVRVEGRQDILSVETNGSLITFTVRSDFTHAAENELRAFVDGIFWGVSWAKKYNPHS